MRFPTKEPVIAALANDIANGLETYPDGFPSPPVSPDQLREALINYLAKQNRGRGGRSCGAEYPREE